MCAATLFLFACTSAPTAPPDAVCRAAVLEQAAAELAGRSVRLTSDAFSSGAVVLQSAAQRNSGRILDLPERLTLLREAGRCVMRHLPSGRQHELTAACCDLPPGEAEAAGTR